MGPRRHCAVDFLDGEGGRPDRKALSYVCHRSCPITFIAFLRGDLPLLFVCSHLLPSLTIKQEHQSLCCCDNRPTWTPSRPPFPLPSVHTGFPNWLDQPVDSDPLSAAAQSGDLADEYELRPLYVPSFMAALLHLRVEPPSCEVGWTVIMMMNPSVGQTEVRVTLWGQTAPCDIRETTRTERIAWFESCTECSEQTDVVFILWTREVQVVSHLCIFSKKKLTLLCGITDASWHFKVTFWTIHFSFNPVQAGKLLIFASSQSSRPR